MMLWALQPDPCPARTGRTKRLKLRLICGCSTSSPPALCLTTAAQDRCTAVLPRASRKTSQPAVKLGPLPALRRARSRSGSRSCARLTREAEGAAHVHALGFHIHRHQLQRRHGARRGAALALHQPGTCAGNRRAATEGSRTRRAQAAGIAATASHGSLALVSVQRLTPTSVALASRHVHPPSAHSAAPTCTWTASRKRPKSRKAGLPSPHRPSRTM